MEIVCGELEIHAVFMMELMYILLKIACGFRLKLVKEFVGRN